MKQMIHQLLGAACLCSLLLSGSPARAQTQPKTATPDYLNPRLPVERRAGDLVGRMTLEEKVSQMMNKSAAIERLGVPAYDWWNEALHGVAYAGHYGRVSMLHVFDSGPTERDLQETYLPAFRAAITEGKAGSVMCAYNSLNGEPLCASPRMLKEILRGEWGFRGYVVSDCDAV